MAALENAQRFLNVSPQFRLGDLPTEGRHPLTHNLSFLAQNDLEEALRVLHQVDLKALEKLLPCAPTIEAMRLAIAETLKSGHKIFFAGCGATGRLSLTLETLWRQQYPMHGSKVIGFMAGGDLALIKSIENFEDHPEFGLRQLDDLGFCKGDLLIGITEGGETPFVIGATEAASSKEGPHPFFVYCNPDDILCKVAERSKKIIENPKIRKVNLFVGPMAISGSTRMQATTVQMLAVGSALLGAMAGQPIFPRLLDRFLSHWHSLNLEALAPLIAQEALWYQQGHYLLYETYDYGITVLTDTTERSPTFSLLPFENALDDKAPMALCYLCLPHTNSSMEAWESLLGRPPRALTWENYASIAGLQRLLGFDMSQNMSRLRRGRAGDAKFHVCRVLRAKESRSLEIRAEFLLAKFPFSDGSHVLEEHLLLKLLLNSLSTLVMGRMKRYHGNVMTWVKPSNFKLIDRTIRYVGYLLEQAGEKSRSYEDIALATFATMELVQPGEPVVLRTVERLLENRPPYTPDQKILGF